jgi:4'-phosphopantetheinyl transferase
MILMIRVYAINIKDAIINPAWVQHVSHYKRQRLAAMDHTQTFVHTLTGDLLVQYLAVQHLGVSYQDLVFHTTAQGKPYLVSPPQPFHFSLSHSGNWVVCAVHHSPVGIDVQLMEPIDTSMVQNLMTPEAYAHYLSLPYQQRLNYFYDLWTQQESYLKLMGRGISAIPQLTPDLPEDQCIYSRHYDLASAYSLSVCAFANDFAGSLTYLNVACIIPKS